MPGVKLCFGLFVFFILFFYFFYIYFLNFISKAQKLYFRNRLNESFSGNVGIFSIFFYFLRKIAKRDKFFKISSECILCNYTPIFVKFSGNIPLVKSQCVSPFGAKNPHRLLMAATQIKKPPFLVFSNISYFAALS